MRDATVKKRKHKIILVKGFYFWTVFFAGWKEDKLSMQANSQGERMRNRGKEIIHVFNLTLP